MHSVTAGRRSTVATTARGDVWAWGDNSNGQLGTGCDSIGQSQLPSLAQGIPTASSFSWRVQALSQPSKLEALDLAAEAGMASILNSQINAADPDLYSVAGPSAACAAACEKHARARMLSLGGSSANGHGCTAFTFPTYNTDLTGADPPDASDCEFFSAAAPQPTAPFATKASASRDLHLFEVRGRGGALGAAAADAHSVVAVGLSQEARCPVSGGDSASDGVACGGPSRGSCILGACVCEAGWAGDGCTAQACDPLCNPERGVCAADDNGDAYCNCLAGWGGDDCTELECPSYNQARCSAHGTCVASGATGRSCLCDEGWAGAACELPLCVGSPLNSCSNHGSCVCSGGSSKCGGTADREQACNCNSGFAGDDCSGTCASGDDGNGGLVTCGSHGTCVTVSAGELEAFPQREGFPAGLRCACASGWRGTVCEEPACPGDPECGGETRGTCERSASSAACACNPGFEGLACETLRCESDCSGNGQCLISADGSPQCECVFGWTGSDCSTNAGLVSLTYSLSIGGGLVAVVIAVGVLIYCVRANQAGSLQGPTGQYRRRQWTRASGGLGNTLAVHTPKRVAIQPAWMGGVQPVEKGRRARIGIS